MVEIFLLFNGWITFLTHFVVRCSTEREGLLRALSGISSINDCQFGAIYVE